MREPSEGWGPAPTKFSFLEGSEMRLCTFYRAPFHKSKQEKKSAQYLATTAVYMSTFGITESRINTKRD